METEIEVRTYARSESRWDAAEKVMSVELVSVDEGTINDHFEKVVMDALERVRNTLLEAKAECLCGAVPTRIHRPSFFLSFPLSHYPRSKYFPPFAKKALAPIRKTP
jgi:hypothetical protein